LTDGPLRLFRIDALRRRSRLAGGRAEPARAFPGGPLRPGPYGRRARRRRSGRGRGGGRVRRPGPGGAAPASQRGARGGPSRKEGVRGHGPLGAGGESPPMSAPTADVLIVGGGVIGCALAAELA